MAQGFGQGPRGGGARRRPRAQGHKIILSLAQAVKDVLETADPAAKVMAARKAARDWRLGRLDPRFDVAMPDRPSRLAHPELLPPNRMPRRGAGTEGNRIALIHSIAHIEYTAIDLAFDLVGRFGAAFPRDFVDDWMQVGAEEAIHFALLDRRLRALGSYYGALPAHDGLWEAAEATAHDALARLAIVPMVLEARGLDITPQMIARFETAKDIRSARILGRILQDEVRHVAAGVRWFSQGCANRGDSPVLAWRAFVATHFGGSLKPPFNDSARAAAGLTMDFYQEVADPHAHRPQKFQSSREGQNPETAQSH